MKDKEPDTKRISFRLPVSLWEKIAEARWPSKTVRARLEESYVFERLIDQAKKLIKNYKLTQLIVTVRGQNHDEIKPS